MKVLLNPSPACVEVWQDSWYVFLKANAIEPDEAEHWDWYKKSLNIGPARSKMLVALVDDDESRCHGLMLVVWPCEARLAPGREAAHVDYLQSAPWNQRAWGDQREQRGIGSLLMSYAIELSYDNNFNVESRPVPTPDSIIPIPA